MTLNASAASPKLAALYLHGSAFAVANDTTFEATYDGSAMTRLGSFDDLINHTGTAPAFYSLKGVNGLLFLIYVPQPGLHDFFLTYTRPPPPEQGLNPIQAAGIAAIVLVVVGAAAAFMWRRRKPRR